MKELWWKLQDKYEDVMADPKKKLIAAAIAGFVIGLAIGYGGRV